jgi:hypothetical protein
MHQALGRTSAIIMALIAALVMTLFLSGGSATASRPSASALAPVAVAPAAVTPHVAAIKTVHQAAPIHRATPVLSAHALARNIAVEIVSLSRNILDATPPWVTGCMGYWVQSPPNQPKLGARVCIGAQNNGGTWMVCNDWALDLNYVQLFGLNGGIPGRSLVVSQEIFFLFNHHLSHSPGEVAAVDIAQLDITGDASWKADRALVLREVAAQNPNVAQLARVWQLEAMHLYGRIGIAPVTFSSHPLVGQAGYANTTLVSTSHVGEPGYTVKWTVVGGRLLGVSGNTGPGGSARVLFRNESIGGVRIIATVCGIPDDRGLVSRPGKGFQHLIGRAGTYCISSSKYFNARPTGPAVLAPCTTNCNGIAPVQMCGGNPAGAALIRYIAVRNGHIDYSTALQVRGGTRNCIVFAGNDNDHFKYVAQYFFMGKWSALFGVAGDTWVNCPKKPAITFTVKCPCVGTGVNSGFQPVIYVVVPANDSRRVWHLIVTTTINGVVTGSKTFTYQPGASASTLALPDVGMTAFTVGAFALTWHDTSIGGVFA